MSLSIVSRANSPSKVLTPCVYYVNRTGTAHPLLKVRAYIKDGDTNTVIETLLSTPDASGNARFDVSNVLKQTLSPEINTIPSYSNTWREPAVLKYYYLDFDVVWLGSTGAGVEALSDSGSKRYAWLAADQIANVGSTANLTLPTWFGSLINVFSFGIFGYNLTTTGDSRLCFAFDFNGFTIYIPSEWVNLTLNGVYTCLFTPKLIFATSYATAGTLVTTFSKDVMTVAGNTSSATSNRYGVIYLTSFGVPFKYKVYTTGTNAALNSWFVVEFRDSSGNITSSFNASSTEEVRTGAIDFSTYIVVRYSNGTNTASSHTFRMEVIDDLLITDITSVTPISAHTDSFPDAYINILTQMPITSVRPSCGNYMQLVWRNSLGGQSTWAFEYSQDYTYTYNGDYKAKQYTLYSTNLTAEQYESLEELHTLGAVYSNVIDDVSISNKSSLRSGSSVYIIGSDYSFTGVIVLPKQNHTSSKNRRHQFSVTIEVPETFVG